MIMAAQNHVGPGRQQSPVYRTPVRQPHPAREITGEDIVMKGEHPRRTRRSGAENCLNPIGLGSRQVPLYSNIPEPPSERTERHAIAAQGPGNHRSWYLEYWTELVKVLGVLGVFLALAQETERAFPPFDVVIPGNYD